MPGSGRPIPDPELNRDDRGVTRFMLVGPGGPGPMLAPLSFASEQPSEREMHGEGDDITLRCAILGLPFLGASARLVGPPTSEALRRTGEALNRLGGRCLVFPGRGAPLAAMAEIGAVSRHVLGLPREDGGSGDPSPATALGVFAAVRACRPDLKGARVAVLGAGRVGGALARMLVAEGAEVLVADRDRPKAEAIEGATVLDPEALLAAECDVLSPNARDIHLGHEEAGQLRCRHLAGAQDILADDDVSSGLFLRGIFEIPEPLAGSGWLANLTSETAEGGYREEEARRRILRIESAADALLRRVRTTGAAPRYALRLPAAVPS